MARRLGSLGSPLRGAVAIALLLALAVGPAHAKKKPRPDPCPGGRFLVPDRTLVAGAATALPDAITIGADGTAAIASGCPAVAAKVKAGRRGTRVRVRWPKDACPGLRGKVRLTARLDAACTTLRGVLRAKRHRAKFAARLSACGDGHADLESGETCDLPPVPAVITLEPAAAAAVTATLGPAGGALEATGPDGTRFVLTVPAGALADPTAITLTPLAAIPDLPMQGGLVAAADMAPDGLQLFAPASLAITLPGPVDLTGLAGFGYHGAGEGVHLALVHATDTTLRFAVTHFSGVGAGIAAPLDVAAIAALPNTPADVAAVNALVALAARGETAPGAYAAVLRQWYDASVGPLLAAAEGSDAALLAALHEWVRFAYVVSDDVLLALSLPFDLNALLGADGFALANRLEAGPGLVAAGLRAAIARANAACRAAGDADQAEAALRWQAIAEALGVATVAAALDRETVLDALCVEVIHEALSFPQAPEVGVPAQLALTAALVLRDGGAVLQRNLVVVVSASGATAAGVSPFTDAQGRYAQLFTPTGGRPVTLRIRTCVAPDVHPRLVAVCQEALVVRGELVVEPTQVTLAPGGTQQFDAFLLGLPTGAVTWTATGGTITPGGRYTAGDQAGTFAVTATSTADASLAAAAIVEIGSTQAGTIVFEDLLAISRVHGTSDQADLDDLPAFSLTASAGDPECSGTMTASMSVLTAPDGTITIASDAGGSATASGSCSINHVDLQFRVVGAPVPYAFDPLPVVEAPPNVPNDGGHSALVILFAGPTPLVGGGGDPVACWCVQECDGRCPQTAPPDTGTLRPGVYTILGRTRRAGSYDYTLRLGTGAAPLAP